MFYNEIIDDKNGFGFAKHYVSRVHWFFVFRFVFNVSLERFLMTEFCKNVNRFDI